MPVENEDVKRILKKKYKDIEPVKDILSELEEDEPKNLEDIKRRLIKK
jgi:hypothetical protein